MCRVRRTIASIKWHITLAAPSSPCPGPPGGVGDGEGAGRPPIPGPRRPAPHRVRAPHKGAHPLHVTLRARAGLVSLRNKRVFAVLRDCFRASSSPGFRVVQFSVQADHVHLLVEAQDKAALSWGARGLAIRSARAIDRAAAHRSIWGDRYHARELATPREVRTALVYVLMNHKTRPARPRRSTPAPRRPGSTASASPSRRRPNPRSPATPHLARPVGWRRRGLIDPTESPRDPPVRACGPSRRGARADSPGTNQEAWRLPAGASVGASG